MSAKTSKILFAATSLFMVLILVGVTATVVFTTKKSGTTTHAANISHYVAPILFYPADVAAPTDVEIGKINNYVMVAAQWWYWIKYNAKFEYLPVRVYRGTQNASYYMNNGVGSQHIVINVYNELAAHEREYYLANNRSDTGFGMWDKATLVFFKGIPTIENPPSAALAYSFAFGGIRGGYSSFPSMVLDTLMGDTSTCNNYSTAISALDFQRAIYCSKNTQYGTVIHEIAHAIANVADITRDQVPFDECEFNIMCGGTFHVNTQNPDGSYADAYLNPGDIVKVQNSPFTNPPDIGSAEWNNFANINSAKPFCFLSTDPQQWCERGGPIGDIPVATGENGFNWVVKSGGDCNVFGCDGPSLTTSWSNVTYRVELMCTNGSFCSNTYNQWTNCSTWPMGTCPPYDTTNNYVDVLAAAGFSYRYRVWVITKMDGNINSVAAYPWVNETVVNNTCTSGTCSVRLTWPSATYDTNLTLNGVIENNAPVNACRGNWVNPTTGIASPCESAWSGTANSHTYTQLNTNTTLDQYVQVKDVNGASHLLQARQNIGTTAAACSGGFCQCSCNAASVPGGTSSSLSGPAGSQSVTLSWSAPGSWGQECTGGYAREYLVKFDTVNPISSIPTRTPNLSLTVNTLKPGTTYYYQVAVQNKGGKVSAYSAVQSFTTAPLDTDHDGFTDAQEQYIGTNPLAVCGLNAWPPDIDGDGQVSILDLTKMAQVYGSKVGDAKYNRRYDMDADGAITILDLTFAGQYFGSKCTNPVKSQ